MVRASDIYKSIDANGNVVYSDHLDSSTTPSTLIQLEDRRFPPNELHFCWTNCFTLILDDGVYRRIDGIDESWTVETFSAAAIVLHRHDAPVDWNGYSRDVVYAGQVANDRLIAVTVNGKPTSGIDASWGSALNTLPGSNAERDAKSPANLDSSGGGLSSAVAPPPVADEDQPELPQDGLLWTPGYWYLRDQAYLWIRGAWVRPPQVGLLWTPAFWSSAGSVFVFHPGRWGSTVGFYGGVNYGHGYFGNGYTGGRWIENSLAYNRSVNRVSPEAAHRTYEESVVKQGSRSTVSYAGGSRSGEANHGVSSQSPSRDADKVTVTTAIQRTKESAPVSMAVLRPAADVKTPAKNAPPRTTHVTSTKAEPTR